MKTLFKMYPARTLIALFTVLMMGCASSERIEPLPLGSPEELVVKAETSMANGDRQAFLECFDASDTEYQVLESVILATSAAVDFRDRFIKSYGEEAWERFQDKEQSPEGADMSLSLPARDDVEAAKLWKWSAEESGYLLPNTYGPVAFRRTEKGWILDMHQMLGRGGEAELKEIKTLMQSMEEFILKYRHAIGQQGITLEDLDYQMGKDLMKEVFGFGLKQPDRFNIEKFL